MDTCGSLGLSLDELIAHEEEPGLGSGGLGRLAACFLESLSSLGVPAIAHGLRYEFGIFDQQIVDGFDIEHPVGFGGFTERFSDGAAGFASCGGRFCPRERTRVPESDLGSARLEQPRCGRRALGSGATAATRPANSVAGANATPPRQRSTRAPDRAEHHEIPG